MFVLGASGDITSGDSPDYKDTNQFNPKFGAMWNPFPATTVRAAAFRVLKRRLITNQTLEPTQVAGFNQFYDDSMPPTHGATGRRSIRDSPGPLRRCGSLPA